MSFTVGKPELGRIRRPDGSFGMLAVDQRESLRALLASHGAVASDDALTHFKQVAVEQLAPHASGVLLDLEYGLAGSVPELPEGCGLIVAADRFVQPAGCPILESELDPRITPEYARQVNAAALKLLVLWRADGSAEQRRDVIGQFLALCQAAQLPSVLEAVVRPGRERDWSSSEERDDAILSATEEFASLNADLYKLEVPGFGRLPRDELVAKAKAITQCLPSPWVVLSSGVLPDHFPDAVAAACEGGADGFLAGRGIWSDALGSDDLVNSLRTEAVARIVRLTEAVGVGLASRNATVGTEDR